MNNDRLEGDAANLPSSKSPNLTKPNSKSNIGTIISKEFKRFFSDRTLLFTTVIMPGLLIYVIYTLMGSFMYDNIDEEIAKIEDQTEFVSPLTAEEQALYDSLGTVLYEAEQAQLSEQRTQQEQQELGAVLGNLIPLLIIMLIFSGCMTVGPTAIAGEKERGTIATLLVTPMRRSELAIGKIVSLSCFALLSGLSSFLGIILSLPKMIQGDSVELPSNLYGSGDLLIILLVISCTVLIIISGISLISAWAKDVKTAGTMVTPFMLVIMLASITPMIGQAPNEAYYLVPLYNSAQVLASVFSFRVNLTAVLITIGSNLCYTALAIWGLTKMFNSEKIMFTK